MANVLIVGANQGIGYYLVERLLELGNTVTVLDVKINAIDMLKEKYQRTVLPIVADVWNLSSVPSTFDKYKIGIGYFSSKRI